MKIIYIIIIPVFMIYGCEKPKYQIDYENSIKWITKAGLHTDTVMIIDNKDWNCKRCDSLRRLSNRELDSAEYYHRLFNEDTKLLPR